MTSASVTRAVYMERATSRSNVIVSQAGETFTAT